MYQTGGSHPILVECDDLNTYLTKYATNATAYNLFNEYIGSSFLKLWNLHTPDFDFIQVSRQHINTELFPTLNVNNFDTICFGTKFSRNYSDIHTLTIDIIKQPINILEKNKLELLLIALFDIWICNEDRTANNPNLMYDSEQNNRFVPIDHQYIFNSSNLQYSLYQINWYDSILYHKFCFSFLQKSDLTAFKLGNIEQKFYFFLEKCHSNLKQIVSQMPQQWNIDQNKMLLKLEKQLFSDSWKKQTWQTFCDFLQELSKQIK